MLALLLVALCHAETLWVATPSEGVRWPGATFVTVKLAVGDEVEVLVRDGDLVRVRRITDFGWVPATSLSETKTEPAGPRGLGDPMNFTFPPPAMPATP